MDYSMMPPPPSSSASVGGLPGGGGSSGDYTSAVQQHFGSGAVDSGGQQQMYNTDQQSVVVSQQADNGSQYSSSNQYKPHFSSRPHVNRPPPLSLHQTYYRDTVTQSPAAALPHSYHEHASPHLPVQSPHIAASPLHTQSPLMVAQNSHIEQNQRVPQSPHLQGAHNMLHRQSSAQHLVQSPHVAQSPLLPPNYAVAAAAAAAAGGNAGDINSHTNQAHLQQQSMFGSDRTHSPHPAQYDAIASPIHHHGKHRHYSDSSSQQSPHPYVHPAMPSRFTNVPNPSPHHYNDPTPSPHHYPAEAVQSPRHFNDPTPSPRHYNDPNPSPYNDPGPHRGHYLDSSQPGTPAAYNSHPGTPAGYLDSPHHVSPHPTRSAYQHFFGPNAHLPPVNGGGNTPSGDQTPCDLSDRAAVAAVAQYSQQAASSQRHETGVNSAMLHTNPGGQGDAMLSAINMNAHVKQDTSIQDGQGSHPESSMDTGEWTSNSQSMKAGGPSTGFNLFDNGSTPSVDDLLQSTTDFISSTNTMSLSDAPKDAAKIKPRPKGRPSKNSMSPRSYGAQCPICGKNFNNSSALAKHKLTHSDERKYICQLCSKAFKRQDHLNGHVMTHRTKKPFECSFEGCTKSYCDARSLRRHLENHHNVPTETLYDMSLNNYGMNNGNNMQFTGFHGANSTPSPQASPSYPNVPGQQFFRFGGEAPQQPGSEGAPPPFMFGGASEAPQPAECTVCHKRFKNLPALNGHMRLHGGYTNAKKPDQSDNKSTKSDSASSSIGDGGSINGRKPASNQNSTGAVSTLSREAAAALAVSSGGAHNLMVLNNKYNNMDPSVSTLSSSSVGGEDQHGNSNHNQNNNQGNVRQDGGNVVASLPPFIGAPLHIHTLSSSEPSTFPSHPLAASAAAASQFSTLGSLEQQQRMLNDQLMMQQLRQLQQQQHAVAAQTAAGFTAGLPPLLTNPVGGGAVHPLMSGSNPITADDYLRDLATRARTDSFPSSSGIFLSNSPGTSKMSEASQDHRQVLTPNMLCATGGGDFRGLTDNSGLLMHQQLGHLEQRRPSPIVMKTEPTSEDHEVSMINLPRPLEESEHFLAQRKRHASAPENLPVSQTWQRQQQRMDQQQQLNEQYAKEQEQAMNLPVHRRRRSSADTHRHNRLNDPFKHPSSYHHNPGDLLTRSDGAALLFKSPPPGGVKKRKHRPEPLSIPPNVAAIQTRLRSPRIWEPGENHGIRHTGKTPPPYTPPPILSPLRVGTGLFCTTYSRSNSIGGAGNGGSLSASLPATKFSQLKQQMSIPEEPTSTVTDATSHILTQNLLQQQPLMMTAEPLMMVAKTEPVGPIVVEPQVHPLQVETPVEPVADESIPPPPETDIQPHINIGDSHQAALPTLRKNRREAERDEERATLLWTPECLDHSLTVQELTAYMDFSCSVAVPGSGSNKEYALHQLYFNKGDLKRAILCLMSKKISPSFVKFIGDYHYQDSDIWTTDDIEIYTQTIMKADKDFGAITAAFNDRKTNKQIVEFYYLWKKVCPDEYKRLKMLRRKKRMSDELYNLRSRREKGGSGDTGGVDNSEAARGAHSDSDDSTSQVSDAEGDADDEGVGGDVTRSISSILAQQQQRVIPDTRVPSPPPPAFSCEYPGCPAMFNSRAALNAHTKIHVLPRPPPHLIDHHIPPPSSALPPAAKKIKPEPIPPGGEEFPCKLCGKVFYKVKSRSAHMKSHSVLAKKQREAAAQAKSQQQQQQQMEQHFQHPT